MNKAFIMTLLKLQEWQLLDIKLNKTSKHDWSIAKHIKKIC